MKRTITAAAVAASLAVGGLAGSVLGTPVIAGAGETATGAASWVQDALQGLVDDGTITEAQSEAVASALEDARPERGHHGVSHHLALTTVAEALGVTEEELRTALADGRTVADVATEQGVDVQVVVDAIVAEVRERVDERVAGGDLTRERADEVLAGAEERATALVNGDGPARRGGHRGRLHGRHGHHRHHGPGGADDVPAEGADGA